MDIGFGTSGNMTSYQNLNVSKSRSLNVSQEHSITIATFFEKMLGLNVDAISVGQPIEVKGFEIRSWNLNSNREEWCEIKRAVRKDDVVPWNVLLENGEQLSVSPEHRLWAKTMGGEAHWVDAETLGLADATFELFSRSGWTPASLVRGEHPIKILDIEVDGTHAYFSNGVLSHNTMYGDPMTTSGGLALPFHASTRISLTGGKRLEDPKTKEFIGIELNAYVMKNKVAPPFRKVSFEIRFGRGIFEGEQLFDVVRQYCDEKNVVVNGKELKLSGTGSWKELTVTDAQTGEVLVNKSFYKSAFGDLMKDPEYKPYLDDLVEVALTRTVEQANLDKADSVDVDPDGYDAPSKATGTAKK